MSDGRTSGERGRKTSTDSDMSIQELDAPLIDSEVVSVDEAPKRCGFTLPPVLLLIIFCFVNLFNYLDRGLIAGVLPELKTAFDLDNTAQGVLAGAFMGGYAIFSPILAYMANYYPPFLLMSIGLASWVASALLAAFTPNYTWLVVARVLSGLGEAGFQNIAPPLIDDVAPANAKGLWLSLFFCCIPVGQALGFVYGGMMAHIWRWAFFIEAVVMAPIVILGLFTRNELSSGRRKKSSGSSGKKRSGEEGEGAGGGNTGVEEQGKLLRQLRSILRSAVWICDVLGYSSFTFVVGAFAFWAPTYVVEHFSVATKDADLYVGGVTVFAGLVGTAFGGALLDWSKRKFPNTHGVVLGMQQMAIAATIGTPICLVAFIVPTKDEMVLFFIILGIGEFLLLMTTSATNAVLMWSVPKDVRPLSMALSVVVMHGLGDVPSPTIVGAIQDSVQNWVITMSATTLYLAICCLFWIVGYILARRADKKGLLQMEHDEMKLPH